MVLNFLVKKYEWCFVRERFLKLYPTQEPGLEKYKYVFECLQSTELIDTNNTILCIDHVKNGTAENDEWDHVYAIETNNKDDRFSLEFEKWGFWLNLPISDETLCKYSELDIICHCLWEMTFAGFTEEDIQRRADDLFSMCDEIGSEKIKTIKTNLDTLKGYASTIEGEENV